MTATIPASTMRPGGDFSFPAGCEPACPGCRHRGLSAAESAAQKEGWVAQQLAPLGLPPLPLRAPASRLGYRRKVLLHAGFADGWRFGLLRRRGWDTELVPIPRCPLHAPGINEALARLAPLLPESLPLAFVLVAGPILTLVLKSRPDPAWRAWAESLQEPLAAMGLAGLRLDWHPSAGRRVLSSRGLERIFGPEFLEEDGFLYGAQSFRQQIPELAAAAESLAEGFLAGAGVPRVLDLYSGPGSTLARWRRRDWAAVGVELVGEACRAAAKNAPGAEVLRGRVEHRLPQLAERFPGPDFVLYTNPPRDGHAPEVTDWIAQARPARIAYLSCNTRSLARDLARWLPFYRVETVQPFDFFPQTDHVECLALLSGGTEK